MVEKESYVSLGYKEKLFKAVERGNRERVV